MTTLDLEPFRAHTFTLEDIDDGVKLTTEFMGDEVRDRVFSNASAAMDYLSKLFSDYAKRLK